MPISLSDDHSELAPLLPIPNRTVKRLSADDSVDSHVKVGHRQTPCKQTTRPRAGFFVCIAVAVLVTCTRVIPVEYHRDRHEALYYKP